VDGHVSWDDHFRWLRLPIPTLEDRAAQLEEAVRRSRAKGYHR